MEKEEYVVGVEEGDVDWGVEGVGGWKKWGGRMRTGG